MLENAPIFNRIKLWRKFKGHAIIGANTIDESRPGAGRGGGFGGRGDSLVQRFPQGGRGGGGFQSGGGGFQGGAFGAGVGFPRGIAPTGFGGGAGGFGRR